MKITFALLAFLVTFFFSPQSQADEAQVGQVERVESRGVFVPIYAVWNKAAVASVVLYSGGGDPCQALHYHGFIGMEKEAVDLIAHWVLHPSI